MGIALIPNNRTITGQFNYLRKIIEKTFLLSPK
jgi:hypothetical protein